MGKCHLTIPIANQRCHGTKESVLKLAFLFSRKPAHCGEKGICGMQFEMLPLFSEAQPTKILNVVKLGALRNCTFYGDIGMEFYRLILCNTDFLSV